MLSSQILPFTVFHVVSEDSITHFSLQELGNAMNGGLDLSTVEIFTNECEAKVVYEAQRRRKVACSFSDEIFLQASSVALYDGNGTCLSQVFLSE